METTSYIQFPASFLTLATILRGVKSLPDANFRGSAWPVARIFTVVPPMSTARTLGVAFISIPASSASSGGWGLGTVKRYEATAALQLDSGWPEESRVRLACSRPSIEH